jgi:two-component system sensor histidine kinase TctE
MASLRLKLVGWLLPPLVVVGVVAAAGAYSFMDKRLTEAYDLDLGDIARALVPHLHKHSDTISLDLTELADAVLRADSSDQIFYSVRDARGGVIAGDALLPLPRVTLHDQPYFWYDARKNVPIRAVALGTVIAGAPVTVIAAETTRKRERAARDAMFSAAVPVLLLSVAGVIAILLGVRRGLFPLDRVRDELQGRSAADLRPLDETHVVDELVPLVHELNSMLARLQGAQETQARFIANAAHQLRTPIAGLVTQLNLARNSAEGREAHVANAFEGATRLARLAQQLLSLAAADPISNPVTRDEAGDLAEVVKSRADAWLREAMPRNVELEFDLEPAPFLGNALLVGELASNLVDNALRYGAANVKVATRPARNGSILEVTDDGPGIPEAERTRIFKRFHRLDSESTQGSGLGLAIVSEIAQRHRARVEVHDAPGGRGTRVTVVFPVQLDATYGNRGVSET